MPTPFPWSSLPRIEKRDVEVVARVARALDPTRAGSELAALEPLVGKIDLAPAAIERWPAGAMERREDVPLVAVILGDATAGPGVRVAIEIDPVVAGRLVDRALGALDGEPRLVVGPATDAERGVLAYLCARALGPSGSVRVVGVVTTVTSLRAALGDGALSAWPARATCGPLEGWLRLWLPDAWRAPELGRAAWRRDAAQAGPLEIALDVVAGRARLSAAELAALGAGDTLLPDELSVHGAPLTGEARLVSPFGGPAIHARLRPDGALVLGEIEHTPPVAVVRGRVASDMSAGQPYESHVGEVPVEVRIELGRVVLRVSELAALRPGEILTTGTPLGARVALRAGEEVVATGELCDVEGELGVRVLELTRR